VKIQVNRREVFRAGWIRYHLSNGWFVDGARLRGQYSGPWKYGIYVPGGSKEGHALLIGGADTLKAALAIASQKQDQADSNLTRMAFSKDYR
jgi:hypothetical protein